MKKVKHYIALLLITFFGIHISQAQKTNPSAFLDDNYIIFEKVFGDLNNDGIEDCILITKGTDKKNIIINRFDDKVDRNRRGIIILFKKGDTYDLILKNNNCFLSENEDGGVYYPPELSVSISNTKVYIDYSHGRYGFWQYTFRYQNSDFELIGYDASDNYGPIINKEISINFLTKKRITRVNTNDDAEGGDEMFEETQEKIAIEKLLKLSEITDFYELDMTKY